MGYNTYVKIYITYDDGDEYIELEKLFEEEVYGIYVNNYRFDNSIINYIQYEDFTMSISEVDLIKHTKYVENEYGIQFDIKNLYFMIESGYM